MKISLKLSILLIVLLFFVLLQLAFLNYFKFEKYTRTLFDSRFMIITEELRDTLEFGLSLGTSLSEMKSINTKLSDYFKLEKSLITITISNTNNEILFKKERKDKSIHHNQLHMTKNTLALENSFKQKEGQVQVEYTNQPLLEIVQNSQKHLFHVLLKILLLVLLLSWIFIHFFLAHFATIEQRIALSLRMFLAGESLPKTEHVSNRIEESFNETLDFCQKSTSRNDDDLH
jgi:hypothetical protein